MKKKTKLRICLLLMVGAILSVSGVVLYEIGEYLSARKESQMVSEQTQWNSPVEKEESVKKTEENRKTEKIAEGQTEKTEHTIKVKLAQKKEEGRIEKEIIEKKNPILLEKEQHQEKEINQEQKGVLLFTGDTFFNERRLANYDRDGINGILSESLCELFQNADITMLNQEFAFSDRGTPMKGKEYTYRLPPDRVQIFRELGVDIVTLANNHTMDFGRKALTDTFLTLKEAGISYVGAGENSKEAKQAAVYEVAGKEIAILAASRVIPVTDWNASSQKSGMLTTYDPTILLKEIKKAKQNHDLVVVYVHWGVMYEEYPQKYQRELAKQYIDSGADMVVGCHPHIMQGIEFYKGKPIFYSIGNFLYGSQAEQTAVLLMQIEPNDISYYFVPCKTVNAYTSEMEPKAQRLFSQYIERISYGVQILKDGLIKEKGSQ